MRDIAKQTDERNDTRTKTRRRFLCAIGVGVGASIAGCTGSGNDTSGDETSPTAQSGGAGGNGATTATTTQTATAQQTATQNAATTSVGEPTTVGEPTMAAETTATPTATEQPTATATATQTATAQPTATATATATPGTSGSSALFTAGEYYRFESGASFRVVSAGSDTLTLEINWETGETEIVQTPRGEFYLFHPAHVFGPMSKTFSFANTVASLAQTRSLSVGSQWTVTPDEFSKLEFQRKGPFFLPPESETVTFIITGNDTIAGVSCTKIEVKVGGNLWKTGCVNEELAFALSYTGYDLKTGQVRDTATVVEYQSGEGQ